MIFNLSAKEISKKFKNKEISAFEIATAFIERAKKEPFGALLSILEKRALQRAKKLDERLSNGETLGVLAAVPVIIKDNIMLEDEICTCASKFLENYKASFSATCVHDMEKEDAIIFAKANMDEFAMGSTTANSAFKRCDNPWNQEYTPGGSSGGSASAVAARLSPLSLGSDTGGSVRQPAAFCGIYGLKPTYGRISRYGLVAFASSLDQVGPFATNIEDLALLTSVIAKPCDKDSTSIQTPPEDYETFLNKGVKGLKIGIPSSFLDVVSLEIKQAFENFIKVLTECGAECIEIKLPHNKYSVPVYYILAPAEASTNLARFDGIRYTKRSKDAHTLSQVYEFSRSEGFGAEVIQRILLGTYVLSSGFQDAYYKKAQKVRAKICEDYDHAFKKCDVIAFPTTPEPPFKHGTITDPIAMYNQDIFTISANMAGLPSLSIPAGFTKSFLPIGIQIQAKQMDDGLLMTVAKAHEDKTSYHKMLPSSVGGKTYE